MSLCPLTNIFIELPLTRKMRRNRCGWPQCLSLMLIDRLPLQNGRNTLPVNASFRRIVWQSLQSTCCTAGGSSAGLHWLDYRRWVMRLICWVRWIWLCEVPEVSGQMLCSLWSEWWVVVWSACARSDGVKSQGPKPWKDNFEVWRNIYSANMFAHKQCFF